MSIKWTKEQLQAIEYDQANPLLVSAAAGSGKTAVLIERIFRRVMLKKVEPEELLVATFTDKAAAQMRQKIDEKLASEMQKTTDAKTLKYLRELKRRFPLAQISTLHAFCLNLIREYGAYLIDNNDQLILQPGFTVMSQTYKKIYLNQAIDEVLTYIYEKISALEVQHTESILDETLNDLVEGPLNTNSFPDDVNTSFVSRDIPDTQDKIEIFNITKNPLSEAEWLEDFDRLALIISDSLNDIPLREQIADSWARLRSMAYFEVVAQDAINNFQDQANDFEKHPVVKHALNEIKSLLNPAFEGLDFALNSEHMRLVSKKKKLNKEDIDLELRLNLELKAVQNIAEILNSDSSDKVKWDQIHEQGKTLGAVVNLAKRQSTTPAGLAKLDFIGNYEPKVLPLIALIHPEFAHSSALAVRNQLEQVQPYFIRSINQIEQDLQTMIRPLARFFETIILVDRRFQKIKRHLNQIDFNDFEHYALRLLDQPEIAETVHNRYKEIYLDEYQDTNPIQETLISRIKCPQVFMVGDLKQSIYRFRYADPGLFRKKLQDFLRYEDYINQIEADRIKAVENSSLTFGYTVLLNSNFRSSETLLAGINDLFSWFMQSEIVEIEYDDNQKLIPGREDLSEKELGICRISLEHLAIPHLINTFDFSLIPEIAELNYESGTDLELAFEALQAVKIIQKELISGRNPGDIAILGRTHRISSIYKQVLTAYGIPVSGGKQETFLETTELKFLTQLMRLLDNMQQDIPLASVMRSQIFGLPFDENELLILRLMWPEVEYFYDVVQNSVNLNAQDFLVLANEIFDGGYSEEKLLAIYDKLQRFITIMLDLRVQSKWLSLAELLDYIFRIADYPDYLTRLSFGDQRLQDVELFQQWANQFEREQGGGLRNFIVYISQITEQKLELEDFNTPPAPSNSVAVMTIHASKGLEYPVVILAGANNKLTRGVSSDVMSYDPEYGLSSYIVDPDEQVTYSSPPNAWHQEKLLSMEWAEEYRLLYVAMTRAEEKLYILSSEKLKSKENEDFADIVESLALNFSRSNFQKLKSYAKIVVAYLANNNSQIIQQFPGSSEIAAEDLAKLLGEQENSTDMLQDVSVKQESSTSKLKLNLPDLTDKINKKLIVGRYEFITNYLSELLTEVAEVNQEFETYSLQNEPDLTQTMPQMILPHVTGTEAIERLKNLLPELKQDDPLNLVPAKITVSEASAAERNLNLASPEQAIFPRGMSDMGYTLRKPEIEPRVDSVGESGKEFGSLIHSMMQFIKLEEFLEQPSSKWSNIFQEQINNMIHKQQLFAPNKKQADATYPLIKEFLKSDLAQRIYNAEKNSQPVYREIPFTLAIPATDLLSEYQQKGFEGFSIQKKQISEKSDQTLIQGMIDLWFMENEQAVLIDYKSDHLYGDEIKVITELKKRYTVQLKYYAMAIEKIIKRPVKECYIWLFRQGKAYQL